MTFALWLKIGLALTVVRFAIYVLLWRRPLRDGWKSVKKGYSKIGSAVVAVVALMLAGGVIVWPIGLADIILPVYAWLKSEKNV